jgi:hypothetical protein
VEKCVGGAARQGKGCARGVIVPKAPCLYMCKNGVYSKKTEMWAVRKRKIWVGTQEKET